MEKLVNEVRRQAENWFKDENYVENVFLKDPEGCLPEGYIDDDLMRSIRNKFHLIYGTLASRLEYEANKRKKRFVTPFKEFVKVRIEPSFEDYTLVVVYCKDKVLLDVATKAWNLWWDSEEDMEKELKDTLREMRKPFMEVIK